MKITQNKTTINNFFFQFDKKTLFNETNTHDR